MLIKSFCRVLNQHIRYYQVNINCPLPKRLSYFMAAAYCVKGHVWQNVSIHVTLFKQSFYHVFKRNYT